MIIKIVSGYCCIVAFIVTIFPTESNIPAFLVISYHWYHPNQTVIIRHRR